MSRLTTRLVPLAFALLAPALAAAQDDPATSKVQLDAGRMKAGDLVARYAQASHRVAVVDPQVDQIELDFAAPCALDGVALRRVLDFHDIVLVEDGELLRVHHRRNLAQKEGPPYPLVAPSEDPAAQQRIVTTVIPIRYGAGNAIFATVRGLLTRDTNRIGNILYLAGPELIVLVDFGPNVSYYREVIASLDRPPTVPQLELSAFLVPRAAWEPLRDLRGEDLLARLREVAAKGAARLIDDARLASVDGRFAVERRLTLDGTDAFLSVKAEPSYVALGEQTRREPGLALDVSFSLDGGKIQRRLRTPVPDGYLNDQTHTFALAVRDGGDASHLVVVVRGRVN